MTSAESGHVDMWRSSLAGDLGASEAAAEEARCNEALDEAQRRHLNPTGVRRWVRRFEALVLGRLIGVGAVGLVLMGGWGVLDALGSERRDASARLRAQVVAQQRLEVAAGRGVALLAELGRPVEVTDVGGLAAALDQASADLSVPGKRRDEASRRGAFLRADVIAIGAEIRAASREVVNRDGAVRRLWSKPWTAAMLAAGWVGPTDPPRT